MRNDQTETNRGSTAESLRLRDAYRSYRSSARKRAAWDPDNPGNSMARSVLFDELLGEMRSLPRDARLLDVGCGTGWLGREMLDSGWEPSRLVCVDLVGERVEAARRRLPGVQVEIADARSLPLSEDSVDAVAMINLLSSLVPGAAATETVDEAARVLRPGGVLLAYEPRLPNPLNRSTRRLGARRLRELFSTSGLEAEARSLTLLPPLARRLGSRTERLYAPLMRFRFLRSHNLVVGRWPS